METGYLDKNKTKKNDIVKTKPTANKTRKCKKGEMFVPSRDDCYPTAEAKEILNGEKADENARKAAVRLDIKVSRDAAAKAMKYEEKMKKDLIKKEEKVKKDAEKEKMKAEKEKMKADAKIGRKKITGNLVFNESFPQKTDPVRWDFRDDKVRHVTSLFDSNAKPGEVALASLSVNGKEATKELVGVDVDKAKSPAGKNTSKDGKGILDSVTSAFASLSVNGKEATKELVVVDVDEAKSPAGENTSKDGKGVFFSAKNEVVEESAEHDFLGKDDDAAVKEGEDEFDEEEEDNDDDESNRENTETFFIDKQNAALFKKERDEFLTEKTGNDFLYPDLNDEQFNVKISSKKEFNQHKYDGIINKNIEEEANKACQSEFEILPHQQFVKNFMSLDTPYNSLLLYHELGTGKTCSAIGITEEMRQYMKQTGLQKKIMIIASPNVQDNFKLQLFDANKLKQIRNGAWNLDTCVGNSLLKEINLSEIEKLPRERVVKTIKGLIKRYYRFMGYDSIALYSDSEIKNLKRKLKRKKEDSSFLEDTQNELPEIMDMEPLRETDDEETRLNKMKVIRKLRDKFDHRLIVIDEFHNIVAKTETSKKSSAKIILQIVRYCKFTRFLLLSATPLYNSHEEILWITNMMNLNDKRAVITMNQVFDKEGNFIKESKNANGVVLQESGQDLLRRKLTGYVSYVRGENPYTFPFRVYPKDFAPKENQFTTFPATTKHFNGTHIRNPPKKYVLNNLFMNTLGNYQLKVHSALIHNLNTIEKFQAKEKFGFRELIKPLSSLNMTYPSAAFFKHMEEHTDKPYSGSINDLHGKDGLRNTMNFETSTGLYGVSFNYEYKPQVLEKYGKIFSLEHIGKYSCKIEAICKAIQNSTGIILVYSRYLEGGLLPLALALEEMGISRYSYSSHVQSFLKEKQPVLNPLTMKAKTAKDEYTAKYAMITGTSAYSQSNDLDIQLITNPSNFDGKHVKVVLISEAGSEGLDFKNIRQVHILDPWYNMSRIEQVIGRAVRNKSHCIFPLSQRNVEIYMHATHDGTELETADIYMYRLSEEKAIQIGQITRIMKESAVDCILNMNQNNFTTEKMGIELEIELSSNKKIKYTVGDKSFSGKCDYMEECEFTCKPTMSETTVINSTSYNIHHVSLNHERIAKRVRQLFRDRSFFTLKGLIKELQLGNPYPLEEIYYTISQFLKNRMEWLVCNNKLGYLIKKNNVYAFQPNDIKNLRASIFEREIPLDHKPTSVTIHLPESTPVANKPLLVVEGQKASPPENVNLQPPPTISKPKPVIVIKPKYEPEKKVESKVSALGEMVHADASPEKAYDKLIFFLNETVTFWNQDLYTYVSDAANGKMEKSKDIKHVGIRTLYVLTSVHGMDKPEMLYYLIFHKLDTCLFREKIKYVTSIFKEESDFTKAVTETYNNPEDVVYSYFRKKMFKPRDADHYVLCITKEKKNVFMVFKKKIWREILATETDNAETKIWRLTFDKGQKVLEKVRREYTKSKEKESLLGFMAILKNSEIDGYGFKNKDVLLTRNALGATCEQANRDMILQKLSILLDIMDIPTDRVEMVYDLVKTTDLLYVPIKDRILRINKHHVCLIYELLLRYFSRKENLPWFLDLEESLETDIIHLSITKSVVGSQNVFDIIKK